MGSKYINNGQQLVTIKDRANGRTPFSKSRRYIVWNETTQTVVSEHGTRKGAQESLNSLR
jgi:hypothetical protein